MALFRNGWVSLVALAVHGLTLAGASAAQTVRVYLPETWKTGGARLEYPYRGLASAAALPASEWVFFSGKSTETVKKLNFKNWRNLSAKERTEYLNKARAANSLSLASQSKSLGVARSCFSGAASTFVAEFFGDLEKADFQGRQGSLDLSFSSDEKMVGVQAKLEGESGFHFRLPACDAPAKNDSLAATLSESARKPASSSPALSGEAVAKILSRLQARKITRTPQSGADAVDSGEADTSDQAEVMAEADSAEEGLVEEGFVQQDQGPAAWPRGVPKFELAADYDSAIRQWNEKRDRPWKGMDLTNPAQREEFARLVLEVFYTGMVDQDSNPEQNLVAQKSTARGWCHMPWLNVGDNGREAFHGLTRERDLEPSPIYPNAPWGSDWGIGFYNSPGCESLKRVWGTASAPKATPSLTKSRWDGLSGPAYFADGTMAVKVLFTTAKFSALNGSVVMKGHVTTKQESNEREVADVSLVQIDIAVKDSTLKGTFPEIDYWVMTTYYFDSSYDFQPTGKVAKVGSKAARGWLKMRPVGVQVGLGTPEQGHSFIFADAKTNGVKGRLNGPADNPKSSCLTCHGAAGASPFVTPGLTDHGTYQAKSAQALEFSQQLALAKRNYESRARKKR